MFARPLKLKISKDATLDQNVHQFGVSLTRYLNAQKMEFLAEELHLAEQDYHFSINVDPATYLRDEFVNSGAYQHIEAAKYSFINKHQFLKQMSLSIMRDKIAAIDRWVHKTEANIAFIAECGNLADVLSNQPWDENDYYQNLCIVDLHTQLLDLCVAKPNFTVADVTKISQNFERKLYGTPPMNTVLKSAIFGVIGAMVGFAIGLVVGGASTIYVGGFGAAPAAFAAALKGSALGMTIAHTSAWSLLGASYGFFSSKKVHHRHEIDKLGIADQIPDPVAAAMVKQI